MNKQYLKRLTLIVFLSVLVVVQEQILAFLPNIQLTVFLLVLYAKKLPLKDNVLIVILYATLDSLLMGAFNLVYTPFLYIGWMLIPLSISKLFKEVENTISLAVIALMLSLVYSWIFVIPNCLIYHLDFKEYLLADLYFELLLALSSFLSVLWLYEPCAKTFDKLMIKDLS